MVGRKKNDEFDRLNYQLQRFEKKVKAYCPICQRLLANTSAKRLISHRNKCKLDGSQANSHGNINEDDETVEQKVFAKTPKFQVINLPAAPAYTNASHSDADIVEEIEVVSPRKRQRVVSSDDSSSSDSEAEPKRLSMMSPEQLRKLSKEKKKKKRKRKDLSGTEIMEITRSLADFVFECNLSFNVVESEAFRNFVQALEVSFVKKIPTRRALSSTLLDDAYNRCIGNSTQALCADSILFVYNCRNFLTKAKSIMCTLSSVEGGSAFVDTQDFKEDTEAGDRLMEIVCEATVKANSIYGTNIYSVMTDNSREMAQLGEQVNVWHIFCAKNVGHQLCDAFLSPEFTEKVVEIVREFKEPQLEKRIVAYGGRKLELPRDGRCGSTRLTYECLRDNLQHMKIIAAEGQPARGRHNNWGHVTSLLFDETFVQELDANMVVLEHIKELLNVCQKSQSSIADSVDAWLTLGEKLFPTNSPHMVAIFNHHREIIFTKYALAAYVLHPFYDKDRLPQQYASKAQHFLLEELNADGLKELYAFQQQRGLFRVLYAKGFKSSDALLFWNLAKIECPGLSCLAIKLLRIPASAPKIVTAFGGQSGGIPVRNRLTPDKTRKLMHILYAARLNKDRKKDDEDEDEAAEEEEDDN
uniref:Uncharacterized protein n=1 Tax=Nyssomyia neivai TaxID=330878 RepID=A0A1L8DA68_9DIPT